MARGGSLIKLAEAALLVVANPATDERKFSRQPGGRDGASRLRKECSVAGDGGVRLLENGVRRRDQVKDEGKRSRLRIRPGCRAAAESVGIDGISPGGCAALRRKER